MFFVVVVGFFKVVFVLTGPVEKSKSLVKEKQIQKQRTEGGKKKGAPVYGVNDSSSRREQKNNNKQ